MVRLKDAVEEFLNVMVDGGIVSDRKTGKIKIFKNPYSPATIKYYRKIYESMVEIIGNKEVSDVTVDDCKKILTTLNYKREGEQTLIVVLGRFFRLQQELGRINNNPMLRLKSGIERGGRATKKDTYYLPWEEIVKLKKIYEPENKYLYFIKNIEKAFYGGILQLTTGMRMSEVISNEWQYGKVRGVLEGITIEMAERLLTEKRLAVKGKGKKYRVVYLFENFVPKECITGLKKYLEHRKEKDVNLKDKFIPIDGMQYNNIWKLLQEKLGIIVYSKNTESPTDEKLRSHIFRHTFAMQYIERGGSLEALSMILGHSSLISTQRYAKASTKRIESEISKIK